MLLLYGAGRSMLLLTLLRSSRCMLLLLTLECHACVLQPAVVTLMPTPMWIMNSSLHSETNATCPAALLHCEPTLTLLPRIGQRCYDQVAFLLLPPLLPCLAANYDHEPYVFTEMTYVVTEITGHGCKRLSEMFKNRTTPQETTDFEWINMDRLTEMWDDVGTGEKDVYHQTMHRRRLRRQCQRKRSVLPSSKMARREHSPLCSRCHSHRCTMKKARRVHLRRH